MPYLRSQILKKTVRFRTNVIVEAYIRILVKTNVLPLSLNHYFPAISSVNKINIDLSKLVLSLLPPTEKNNCIPVGLCIAFYVHLILTLQDPC